MPPSKAMCEDLAQQGKAGYCHSPPPHFPNLYTWVCIGDDSEYHRGEGGSLYKPRKYCEAQNCKEHVASTDLL